VGSDPPAPEPDGDETGSVGRRRDPRLVIARRELRSLTSEKTIVLALVIQLFVATFSSFLVVGLVSLYSPGSAGGFTPDFGVTGNASGPVAAAAQDVGGLDLREFPGETEARAAFDRGDVDATLAANYAGNGSVRVVATAPETSLRTTLVVVKTREVLEELERGLRERFVEEGRIDTRPLALPTETGSSPYFGFTYTVLIPLLMFLPVFISGSIAVDSLTEEVQRGTLELLRSAPITLSTIVDAKVLSTATLAPAQAALWLALLRINGTAIAEWPALLAMVAGISAAVVAVGTGISLVAPDRRQAQFLYSSGMLVLALGGVLLPEHPANTVAKLAIGSATDATWIAVAGYALLGVVALAVVRAGVRYVDAEGL
jgi:ABC-type Na+ efflux pump permease subunit